MKRLLIPLAILLMAACPLRAGDDVSDIQGRFSIGAEKKIVKGLSVSLEEEIRVSNRFHTFDRLHTTLGLEYKVNKYFRVGAGTSLINNYKPSSGNWIHKQRVYLDLTGRYKAGIVVLSLRERLQMTHRYGSFNKTETTPNLLALKSRFKIALDFNKLEPYAYFEARNIFNGPSVTVGDFDEDEEMYNYTFNGYKNMYFNRFRTSVGLQWNISRHHSLDAYFLGDYVQEITVDTNKNRQYLKSLFVDKGFISTFGVGYKFKF